jgi:hypothetical protein
MKIENPFFIENSDRILEYLKAKINVA